MARSDRWLVHSPRVRASLLSAAAPLVIDLGYGALPVTTLELAGRRRSVRDDVWVVGLKIHPERVVASQHGVEFWLGGFELAGLQPILVRAFNVLRQYHVDDVSDAWAQMRTRLAPGGLILDGTCDELGRRCCWVLLDESGPVSLALACDPFAIEKPSDLAERLPKILIHHNVAGQPIHRLLTAADRAWAAAAGHGVFGPRVRWRAMLEGLAAEGYPVQPPRRRRRRRALRAVGIRGTGSRLARMRIALAQIKSGTDPAANLGLVEDFTRRAAEAGARVVLFPEATMCRFGVPLKPVAEPLDGPWASGVRAIAERFGVVVVAGMFCPAPRADPAGRVTNTLIATGEGVDEYYHKIHLYDAFGFTESRTVASGYEPAIITVDDVGIGLTTCYDIRFPELFVELAERGAKVVTVHASWGSGPGKLEQWTLLARARALDSACVVAAVGQAYPGDEVAAVGPTGVGGSLVATPTGEVVAEAGADPQLLVVDVDLNTVTDARDTIAVLRNRAEFAQSGKAQSLR